MLLPFVLGLQFSTAWANPCTGTQPCVEDLTLAMSHPHTRGEEIQPSSPGEPLISADAFKAQGLRPEVFSLALKAWQKGWKQGDTQKKILTVIDYSLPSDEKRLWVVDLESGKLLFHEYVAHGTRSGGRLAKQFSNTSQSRKSNVGLLKTAETYQSGKFGYSLRLDGLEKGFNDNARRRAIVMHRANYATADFVHRHGRLGRSWGCPALDPAVTDRIIDTIKGGTLIFGYADQEEWLAGSDYLN